MTSLVDPKFKAILEDLWRRDDITSKDRASKRYSKMLPVIADNTQDQKINELIEACTKLLKQSRSKNKVKVKTAVTKIQSLFKEGQIVIVSKEIRNGKKKRFVYAENEKGTAQKIGKSLRVGSKKRGYLTRYDSIVVVHHKDFEAIANSFIAKMATKTTAKAQVTSEEITSQAAGEQLEILHKFMAQKAVRQARHKKPNAQINRKSVEEQSKKSTGHAILRQQAQNLEAEKTEQKRKKKIRQKILRKMQLVKKDELKSETTKEALQNAIINALNTKKTKS